MLAIGHITRSAYMQKDSVPSPYDKCTVRKSDVASEVVMIGYRSIALGLRQVAAVVRLLVPTSATAEDNP